MRGLILLGVIAGAVTFVLVSYVYSNPPTSVPKNSILYEVAKYFLQLSVIIILGV
jgi:hypothetical protein